MSNFTDIWQYMPHGMCLLWQPWLVVLWAGSDLLIFLSYSAIPIALLTVLKRRGDVPHGGLVMLFASFILLCGITHALSIVTLWVPIYPQLGLIKLATGLVSCVTALALFRLIPTLVALPSPADMAAANARLRGEIEAHKATLASLEATVEARTAELSRVNAMLAVQAREAVHRSGNLLSVVSSIAQQSARSAQGKDEFLAALQGRILALADATRTVMQGGDGPSSDVETVVRTQLEKLLPNVRERVTIAGPAVAIGSEAAQQLGLALHELATNAQKYSLGPVDAARVAVSWSFEEPVDYGSGSPADPDGATFRLTWQEYGAGPARDAETQVPGFGTRLLTRVIPTMLRGSAHREFTEVGLVYRLEVPLSAILPDPAQSGESRHAAEIVDRTFGV
jgi:two-component sensor histidine kinase